MRVLVAGGGQVGGSVAAALAAPPALLTVPWKEPARAVAVIRKTVAEFIDANAEGSWGLCWSAGAGVVGTPAADLEVEVDYLRAALETIGEAPSTTRRRGRVLLTSSAGGIHASSGNDVVTEHSAPSPRSAYGEHKLRQEGLLAAFAADAGVAGLRCRISNVYGPSQNMAKAQGFVSHLCRAVLRRESFVLTVPPDTVRDFIFSRDVGGRIAYWLERDEPDDAGQAPVKLLASGRSTTLDHVIAVVGAVARVPARITVSPLPTSPDQAMRTRFKSVVRRDIDVAVSSTTLEEGVHATWQHMLRNQSRAS